MVSLNKRRIYVCGLLSLMMLFACKEHHKPAKKASEPQNDSTDIAHVQAGFSIEILDEAALEIIDPTTPIRLLASGFEWTEGPLWIEDGKYLLFSDIPRNKIYKLDSKNDTTTYLEPSGFTGKDFKGSEPGSNGLLLNAQGELVLMQHGDRRVSRMNAALNEPRADYSPLAMTYKAKRLNSPNDGVFDRAGNLYFTDPPYGLPRRLQDSEKELDYQGVYCLLRTGELVLLDDRITFPNGIGLSPDESVLYVAESNPENAAWYAFDVIAPGKVNNRKILADLTHLVGKEGQQGLPDGLKVHSSGTLFATGPGGVWVFAPSGIPLARIRTGQHTANCAFSADEKTLYMTADGYIVSVVLK